MRNGRCRALTGSLVFLASLAVAAPAGAQIPALTWAACGEDIPAPFQCATASVPLDHERPDGRTVALAVVRHPAERPEARIGSLFMNPGGPGGSGFDLAVGIHEFLPQALRDRFDVVGFDPRGVERSDAIECWDRKRYDAAFAGTRGAFALRRAVRLGRAFAAACVRRSRDLLPYIGTEYVARDMDLLRAAVGDAQLTYFGFSFGSFIGTVYANLFPDRVRALTLDGAYDPVTYARRPYAYDRGQFVALERSLSHFLAWCSRHPGRCGFGDGRARRAFDALVARSDALPRRIAGPEGRGTINAATLLYEVAFAMNGGRAGWPSFGAALERFRLSGGRRPFIPVPTGIARLFASNTAVECADRAYPRSRALLAARLRAHARLGARLGPLFAYGPPGYDHSHAATCVQWPAFASDQAPSRYTGGFGAAGAAPILVVGTTGDPDTPYPDAVALARTLDSAALLTLRGEGHTAFLRSRCATEQVVDYLVDLRLPTRPRCDDEPGPPRDPGAARAILAALR